MSVTFVENCGNYQIHKLHSPDKTAQFGYRVMPKDYDGTDVSLVKIVGTLTEAREHAGFNPRLVQDHLRTKPKSAYPQNQKGYRASK